MNWPAWIPVAADSDERLELRRELARTLDLALDFEANRSAMAAALVDRHLSTSLVSSNP